MRIGSLCSGAGMLDEAVRSVLGGEVVWHAETDPAASRVLAYRYPGVPNLGDLTTTDWTGVEPVEVVCAGYPCQPDSLAGKGLSEDDHRWIWPDIARAVGVLRPRLVVLENVAGHFVRGFRAVLGSLAALGFDAEWTLVRASDVGAPHRRDRLFVVARAADAGLRGRGQDDPGRRGLVGQDGVQAGRDEGAGSHRPDRASATDARRGSLTRSTATGNGLRLASECRDWSVADSHGDGRESVGRVEPLGCDVDRRGSADVAWGQYEPAIRRWEHVTGRAAPAPTEPGPRGGQRLSPKLTEWMMGWPAGWVTDVPGISRNDALRICGNGVVPQQAAAALSLLLDALEAVA